MLSLLNYISPQSKDPPAKKQRQLSDEFEKEKDDVPMGTQGQKRRASETAYVPFDDEDDELEEKDDDKKETRDDQLTYTEFQTPVVRKGSRRVDRQRIDDHETKINSIAGVLNEQGHKINSIASAVSNQDRKINDIANAVGNQDRKISEIANAVGNQDRKISEIANTLGDHDNKIVNIASAVAGVQQSLSGLSNRLAEQKKDQDEQRQRSETRQTEQRHKLRLEFKAQMTKQSDNLKALQAQGTSHADSMAQIITQLQQLAQTIQTQAAATPSTGMSHAQTLNTGASLMQPTTAPRNTTPKLKDVKCGQFLATERFKELGRGFEDFATRMGQCGVMTSRLE